MTKNDKSKDEYALPGQIYLEASVVHTPGNIDRKRSLAVKSCDPAPTGDPDQAKCCEMDPEHKCFMKSIPTGSMYDKNEVCSKACQKKYPTIPYSCYQAQKHNFRWIGMRSKCDPVGAYDYVWDKPPDAITFNLEAQQDSQTSGAFTTSVSVMAGIFGLLLI